MKSNFIFGKFLSILFLSTTLYSTCYASAIPDDTSFSKNIVSSSYSVNSMLRSSRPNFTEWSISNVTDEGFDFHIKFSGERELTALHVPYWKRGNYKGRSGMYATKVGYNEFKVHIKMRDIGSGTEYVYVGIHPTDDLGSYFICDIPIKLDSIVPSLTLSQNTTAWTKGPVTITSVSTDNMNIIEDISFTDATGKVTKTNVYSEPKILLIRQSGEAAQTYVALSKKKNLTTVYASEITSVSQVKDYDVVLYDGCYFSIDGTLANILNQAYNEGVSIITNFNDSADALSVTQSTYSMGGRYTFYEYENENSSAFYHLGRINRFAYLINGLYDDDDGYWNILPENNAFIISQVTHADGSKTPGIVMATHANGNKWIHVQAYGAQANNNFLDRALDEIMHGTMKSRQTYTNTFSATQNGTYYVEANDFSGNKTKKSITINNIDTTAPTLNVTGNPSAWSSSITLKATASDSQSGVKKITLPDGTTVNGSTATFKVTANGSYTFKAEDNVGNISTSIINVTKLDVAAPTSTITVDSSTTTGTVKVYLRNISDNQSGATTVEISENSSFTSNVTRETVTTLISKDISYKLTQYASTSDNYKNRAIYVRLTDAAGNSKVYTLSTNYSATVPTVSLTSPNENAFYSAKEVIPFKWTFSTGNTAFKSGKLTITNTETNQSVTKEISSTDNQLTLALPEGTYRASVSITNSANKETVSNVRTFRVNRYLTNGQVRSKVIDAKKPIKFLKVSTTAAIPLGATIEGRVYYQYSGNSTFDYSKYISFKISDVSNELSVLKLPVSTNKVIVEYKLNTNNKAASPILDGFIVYAK